MPQLPSQKTLSVPFAGSRGAVVQRSSIEVAIHSRRASVRGVMAAATTELYDSALSEHGSVCLLSPQNFRNIVLPALCPNNLINCMLGLCTKPCQVLARKAQVCTLCARAYSRPLTPLRSTPCRKCPKVLVTDSRSSAHVCNAAVTATHVQCKRVLSGEEMLSKACL